MAGAAGVRRNQYFLRGARAASRLRLLPAWTEDALRASNGIRDVHARERRRLGLAGKAEDDRGEAERPWRLPHGRLLTRSKRTYPRHPARQGDARSLQTTGLICRDRSAANRCAAASSASYSGRHWDGMFARKYAAVITVPVGWLPAPWPTSTMSPRKQVELPVSITFATRHSECP